jgi:ABC-type phosphate transport system substrate-binding protein
VILRTLVFSAFSTLVSIAAVSQSLAETLVIQGSTTFARRIEAYKNTIEAISKHELTLIPNKTLPGLVALLEGRAQLAMTSAPLKNESEALKTILPSAPLDRLEEHEILNTRIAFALNPANRVRSGSLDQVRQILLGNITNWAALGGDDLPIRVALVSGGGGVTSVIESELLDGQSAAGPHIIYVKTPIQVIQVVEQLPGAIGFAQVALAEKKGLPELVTEKTIQQTLSLVTFGPPTQAMTDVIQAFRRVAEKAAL